MLGAIIGDIAGSKYEWNNHRDKDLDLFSQGCFFTDDSVMTFAVADALLKTRHDRSRLEEEAAKQMHLWGNDYPGRGYGGRFASWLASSDPKPYNSFGNGAAMRVSPCGLCAKTLEEAKAYARAVTMPTHNHPEGLKAADALTTAIFLARHDHASKEDLRELIERDYYKIDFTLEDIRATYRFDETCQGCMPQAFEAFFESTDFEDALLNAISIGGDSDTLAAITGGLAEAYYGVPGDIRDCALWYLDERQLAVLNEFEMRYPC